MDLNTALSNLTQIILMICIFGGCGVLFANMMAMADTSTRHEDDYDDEDENDDLFENDEFTEMDAEDEDELQRMPIGPLDAQPTKDIFEYKGYKLKQEIEGCWYEEYDANGNDHCYITQFVDAHLVEQHDALGFGRTKKDSLQEAYEYINEHVTQTEMAV
jgi:hypothetical protein